MKENKNIKREKQYNFAELLKTIFGEDKENNSEDEINEFMGEIVSKPEFIKTEKNIKNLEKMFEHPDRKIVESKNKENSKKVVRKVKVSGNEISNKKLINKKEENQREVE